MADDDDGDLRFDVWPCVVGRFQPFHRDHLSLVVQAAAEYGRVIVAVTNAEVSWRAPVAEAPHRHLDDANPFTYWQRADMILAATCGLIAADRLRVTPFPIHDASVWDAYLPPSTECWVRGRGPWEDEKIRLLATRYPVRVLDAVPNEVNGSGVRGRLAAGDECWRDDVPPPVAGLIDRWRSAGLTPFPPKPSSGGYADGHPSVNPACGLSPTDLWRRPSPTDRPSLDRGDRPDQLNGDDAASRPTKADVQVGAGALGPFGSEHR